MAAKEYSAQYPEKPPAWYWIKGLHDAGITEVEVFEFPFDYKKFIEEKNKYTRNLLKLKVDSKGALFDTTVKEIRFYNYKILTPDISLENRKVIWWLSDRLSEVDGYFVLEIDLHDSKSYPEDLTFKVKFERAEVIR